jgi:hypothetical protein
MKPKTFEHTAVLRDAEAAMARLRKCSRKLHFIAGGNGYDNMGRRELDHVRDKIDEADFWLAAASRALNAGGKRAHDLGYIFAPDEPET